MANVKKRLDVLLVERGLAESRQRAQAVIMSGQVYVREQKVDKAGTQVEENAPIEVRGQALAYVSRGGLKLEKALKTFSGIRLKYMPLMPGRPPAALPTVCSKMGRKRCMQWMWAMDSWPGACAVIPGWCAWSGPTCAI